MALELEKYLRKKLAIPLVIFGSLLLLFVAFAIIYPRFFLDQRQAAYEFEIVGRVIDKDTSIRGITTIHVRKVTGGTKKYIRPYNSEYKNFVRIGDSIVTYSGESTIQVIRNDSTYFFPKFVP